MNFEPKQFTKYIKEYAQMKITGDIYMLSYYSSFFDNLGMDDSDIDVYIIYDGIINDERTLKRKYCDVLFDDVDNLVLDIEFYTLNQYNEVVERTLQSDLTKNSNVFDIDMDRIKLIHKISHSEIVLYDNRTLPIDFYVLRDRNEKTMIRMYYNLFRADLDDAKKFYGMDDFFSAYIMQQKAFLVIMLAYFAHMGIPIVKTKWLYRRLEQTKTYDDGKLWHIFEKYYMTTREAVTQQHVEDFFRELQNLAIEVQN